MAIAIEAGQGESENNKAANDTKKRFVEEVLFP
jgi:hypothetical protein